MQLLNQATPIIYAILKKNRTLRNILMSIWRILSDVVNWWRSFSTNSPSLSPPTSVCHSTQDWVNASAIQTNHLKKADYFLIYPSHKVTRVLPKTIDTTVHWKFKVNQQREFTEAFVAAIPNGRVWGEGHVITPDNQLLGEVSKVLSKAEFIPTTKNHPIFSEEKLPPAQKVAGSVAVLSSVVGTGYYHWFFDILPRLQLLEKAGIALESIDKFIVNRYVSKFQQETFNALGIPRSKILETHWYPHIQAEQLLVPALPGETSHMPKWACDFLRDNFSSGIVKPDTQPLRLYLNRSQVVYRQVENETAIIEFLSGFGFCNVTLDALSVKEQAELMAMAEVVIAPHGAGLTNIVFCQPGTKIIEFLSPKAVNFMYWSLSNQMELDYYYLLTEGEVPPEPIDPYANNDNILVNLSQLSQIL
ncbi:MAG: glycosyltransferase family 61 protein, partial [Richelia sp. SM1_7_0]|nr:glycosyltransferase family 61 protein [Richelia sp. SM1_7_0]